MKLSKKAVSAASLVAVINAPEPQPSAIEAKTVEMGIDRRKMSAAMNLSDYLAAHVVPKYESKYYIAFPSREEAVQTWRGWKMLRFNDRNDTLEEVTSADEATKTHSNILCWRDQRIQNQINDEWLAKQRDMDKFINMEGTKTQAAAVTNTLKSLSGGKISASPLSAGEQD